MDDKVEVKPGNEPIEQKKSLDHEKYGMREVVIPLGSGQIRFNPVTSIFAIAFLWGRKFVNTYVYYIIRIEMLYETNHSFNSQ